MTQDEHGHGVNMELRLQVNPEVDPEDQERLTRQLRIELLDLDVDAVTLAFSHTTPPGAKVADPVTLGAIIVAMSASGGVFTSLIGTLQDWLHRNSGANKISVSIGGDTIALDKVTVGQQRELVAAFVSRHSVR
jgi:hypothetical protein